MDYIITEGQFELILGDIKMNEKTLLRLKALAEPYTKKRQFMNAEPEAYYAAKKLGILDDLKDWEPTNVNKMNLPNLKKKINTNEDMTEQELTEKCWPGYTQKGMKTMFGKRYPNCVKKTKK